MDPDDVPGKPPPERSCSCRNASALPLTVLYDKDGREVWRVMGGYDWSSAAARKAVAEALT